ncbi:response regulator [Phormidium sp. LEGE 05292]|uniref:response regulator n=1 Tax=[Phormidium] sp. LEGE 05292 TaxID=767427 RepID=UPI00187F9C40|nr:response regulator [Phormidium sp. LEGE 05292]MBE9229616.1 response regulator [Phormidium sp. LEGE 05292]
MKILLVEDDPFTGELISATLKTHRYIVEVAPDGQIALALANVCNYDLIILDVQIPKLDGISVCRQLRSSGCSTPILMLTAKDSNDDVVIGLDAGADDYVAKPCEPAQLLARIRALIRRGSAKCEATILTYGDLSLDPALARVKYQQEVVNLRSKEYSLLELFLRHPQRIFSRNAIIDHLWKIDNCPTEHAVTNLIKDLRRQLKAAGMKEDFIETVYGLGYRVKTPPSQSEKPKKSRKDKINTTQINQLPTESVAINRIIEHFRSTLEQRLKILAEVVPEETQNVNPEQLQQAKEEAHRLAGSLGTFGYPKGSQIASAIEQLLKATTLEEQQVSLFSQLLMELKQELNNSPQSLEDRPSTLAPQVLTIGEKTEFAETLIAEASVWGWQIQIISDKSTVLEQIADATPIAILLLLNCSPLNSEQLSLLWELRQEFPSIPFITLGKQDNLDSRVQVARLGSDKYLVQPVTPTQVLEAISQLLMPIQEKDAKVMAVDDDPFILKTLTTVLQPWGVQVTCLDNPQQFWDVLKSTEPDLLLLDLEMPTFNGIELCQVVRQDPKYGDLPILVVSAHTDRESTQQVFAAGADDMISKPIIGPELVTRVISRIERSRLRQQLDCLHQQQIAIWQQQARIDPLTQIPNRRALEEFLQQQWQQLIQEQETLCFILCDVDHFKHYNDLYGHPAGDICLKQIATAIQESIKSSDLVARYGGEEFAVILPKTSLDGALRVAQRIQQKITQLQIPHASSKIKDYVTISMGITGKIPRLDQSFDSLIAIADEALYTAKNRGRNTYCLYPL